MKKSNFLATDEQVTQIARDYLSGADAAGKATSTYLQILTAHSLNELGKSAHKRHSQAEALAAVETAHSHLYGVVQAAVNTPDILADASLDKAERARRARERNRRSTFARVSKSALAGFVKAGGRLMGLDPATVTREQLQAQIRSARGDPDPQTKFEASTERMESALRTLAESDPEQAREALEAAQMRLQAILSPPKQIRGRRKVGEITLTAEH